MPIRSRRYTDDMRTAVAWALLRHVWQSFDSGGESNRSRRSRALEMAMASLRRRLPEDAVRAVGEAARADYDAFHHLASQCHSHDQTADMVEADRAGGIGPIPGSERLIEGGIACQDAMADLLRRHGWPDA